jgi:hypothetical protein
LKRQDNHLNRWLNQFTLCLEKRQVNVFCSFSVGASGAPTLLIPNSKGIKSIVRNSAGNYTLTFQDNFVKFLGMDMIVQNSSGIAAAPNVGLISANVQTVPGTLNFVTSSAGSATDPASGDTVYLSIRLGDSTAQ